MVQNLKIIKALNEFIDKNDEQFWHILNLNDD